MWLDSIHRVFASVLSQRSAARSSPARPARTPRLRVESLEDRIALAAFVLTDKPAYVPGETAILTAGGFVPGAAVTFRVLHDPTTPGIRRGKGHRPFRVRDGSAGDLDGVANGIVVASYFVHPDDSAGAKFRLTARGKVGQRDPIAVARRTFIESRVPPVTIPGNPKCQDLFPNNPNIREFKLEDGQLKSGTYTSPDGFLTVKLTTTPDPLGRGQLIAFETNIGVDGVFVKGGPGGNFYNYEPTEVTLDTGLHTPVNPNNGKFYGISHISFCYDVDPAIRLLKGGPARSKIGDRVTYIYRVSNPGAVPLTNVVLTDDRVGNQPILRVGGDQDNDNQLDPDEVWTYAASITVPAGADDPFTNTATVRADPVSGGMAVSHTASHTVNLFQPAISIVKSGPLTARVGQLITYTYDVRNTGSADSPGLANIVLIDGSSTTGNKQIRFVGGDVNKNGLLDIGEVWRYRFQQILRQSNPLRRAVTVTASPARFPNVLTGTADIAVDLLPGGGVLSGGSSTDPFSKRNLIV